MEALSPEEDEQGRQISAQDQKGNVLSSAATRALSQELAAAVRASAATTARQQWACPVPR